MSNFQSINYTRNYNSPKTPKPSLVWIILSVVLVSLALPYLLLMGWGNIFFGNPLLGITLMIFSPFLLPMIPGYFLIFYHKKKNGLGIPDKRDIKSLVLNVLFGIIPGMVLGYFIIFGFLLEMYTGYSFIGNITIPSVLFASFFLPPFLGYMGSFIFRFLISGAKIAFFKERRRQALLAVIIVVVGVLLPILTYNILAMQGRYLVQSVVINNFKDFIGPTSVDGVKKLVIEADLLVPKDSEYQFFVALYSFKSLAKGSEEEFNEYFKKIGASNDWANSGNYNLRDSAPVFAGIENICPELLHSSPACQIPKGKHKMVFGVNLESFYKYKAADAVQFSREKVSDRQLFLLVEVSKPRSVGIERFKKSFTYTTKYYVHSDYFSDIILEQ